MKRKWYFWLGLMVVIYMFTFHLFQWFRVPLEIAQDPLFGIGQLIGRILIVVLGVWLMRKGGKKVINGKL